MIIASLFLTLSTPMLAMQAAQTIKPAAQNGLTQRTAPNSLTEIRLNECLDLSVQDPASGIFAASEWKIEGGGFFADHCLGFAYAEGFQFEAAMASFEASAQGAALAKDEREARFWLQAANAGLAAQKPLQAIGYIDAAMALNTLEGEQLGEAHLDKARALVGLNLEDEAAKHLLLAQKYAAQDPLVWLLSATLNRRLGNSKQARLDADVASQLAPTDPSIALELGNIEASDGNYSAAQSHWRNAIELRPAGRIADIARASLAQLAESGSE